MSNQKDSKHTERKLQADCFQWVWNSYKHLRKLLYHVPNGGDLNPITANLLKASGVVAGVPDLVFHFRGRTYFFELKRPNGKGVVSKDQKEMHQKLDEQRFIVWVVDSFEDFKRLFLSIINDTSQQFTLGLTKEDFYYRHKIFDYLYKMNEGQLVMIEEICEEETQSKFMNHIQEFMTEGFDKLEGFEILFTPDYLGFYKKVEGSETKIEYKGTNTV